MRLTIALLCLLFVLATAAVALPPKGSGADPRAAMSDNDTFIDINQLLMYVTNTSTFGRDLAGVFGYDYGTWYPYGGDTSAISSNIGGAGDHSPLYSAGLWLGGVTASGDTLVAITEYASEFVPGPMAFGTFQPDRPDFRVYKLYRDSLGTDPSADYSAWPTYLGAPTHINGLPVVHGDQMLWSVYNDADPSVHDGRASPGMTDPMGIEVQMTTYAYDQSGAYDDLVFLSYKLYNRGGNHFHDFYFSLWADPDIGTATNDYVGCDTVDQIWFAYNSEATDNQYSPMAPPALGFKLIHGPLVPAPGETARFENNTIADYKNLDLTSFNKYVNGTDPWGYQESYRNMNGLLADGSPYLYLGNPVKFVHSGNPVTGTGDLDVTTGDRRMMASVGPFDFAPGDSQYVLIAVGAAIGPDYLSSITLMKGLLNTTTVMPSPKLASIPDRYALIDNEVTVELAAAVENSESVTFDVSPPLANSSITNHGDGSATFSFTPDIGQVGNQVLTFIADNGSVQDDQTATIHVLATNADPVLEPIGDKNGQEGSSLAFWIYSSDVDGTTPITSASNLPPGATFFDDNDGTGLFSWYTDYDDSGTYMVTFYATDSLFSSSVDSEVVTIHIADRNQMPYIISPTEGTPIYGYTNHLLKVDIIAEDLDGDSLTMSVIWLWPPPGAVFEDNFDNTGTLTWLPAPNQTGNYFLSFRAADAVSHFDLSTAIVVKCCYGMRGNANGDPEDKVNISDVTYLTEYLFGTPAGPAPNCMEEGNANGDPEEKVNITDVTFLVQYLFGVPAGPLPPDCPLD